MGLFILLFLLPSFALFLPYSSPSSSSPLLCSLLSIYIKFYVSFRLSVLMSRILLLFLVYSVTNSYSSFTASLFSCCFSFLNVFLLLFCSFCFYTLRTPSPSADYVIILIWSRASVRQSPVITHHIRCFTSSQMRDMTEREPGVRLCWESPSCLLNR